MKKRRRWSAEPVLLLLILAMGMIPLVVAALASIGAAAVVGSGTLYILPSYTPPGDGDITPIAPTPTSTPTPSATPTPTHTPTVVPTATPTPTPTHTPTVVPTATFTPTPTPAATRVVVSPDSIVISLDQRFQFQAQVLDIEGNHLLDRAVTWSSDDPGLADISSEGEVTGVSIGCTFITATSNGRRDVANVSVIPRSGRSRVVWITFDRAVDGATVSPSDFRVADALPFSAKEGPGANQITLVVPVYGYPPMPPVELVGLVADARGLPASITCIQPGT